MGFGRSVTLAPSNFHLIAMGCRSLSQSFQEQTGPSVRKQMRGDRNPPLRSHPFSQFLRGQSGKIKDSGKGRSLEESPNAARVFLAMGTLKSCLHGKPSGVQLPKWR